MNFEVEWSPDFAQRVANLTMHVLVRFRDQTEEEKTMWERVSSRLIVRAPLRLEDVRPWAEEAAGERFNLFVGSVSRITIARIGKTPDGRRTAIRREPFIRVYYGTPEEIAAARVARALKNL